MNLGGRTIRRTLFWAGLVFLAAGIAAPFINAARFEEQIHDGLERSLQRRVEIAGKIRFTLFTGPGFVVDDVLIAEDPRVGIEPFAHVSSLSARIQFRSLWTGKLEFSNLRLEEPSVNLVKTQDGPWNIQPFLRKAVGPPAPSGGAALPDIQVRGGRLNFKFGDTKSVFYVANADVDITALTDAGDAFSVKFEGEPARTDRSAQNFGSFSGRGQWKPAQSRESEIELSVRWDKSPIAEFLILLLGRDTGVHGSIAGQAKIAGPLSDLRISGRAQVEDIHRWDLMPTKGGGWPLSIRGRLDLREERLELETSPEQTGAIGARFRLTNMLTKPEYGFIVIAQSLPLAPLFEIARHMGAPVAAQLELTGSLSGAVGYSSHEGLHGSLTAVDATAKVAESPALHCERAEIIVEHDLWQVLPAQVALGRGQAAQVRVEYDRGDNGLEVQITSRGLNIAEMKSGTGRLLGAASIPVLEHIQDGKWKGGLRCRFRNRAAPEWSGNLEIESARMAVEGIAEPVKIHDAKTSLNGDQVAVSRLRGTAGKIEFEGEYRYQPGAARPHVVTIRVESAAAAEIERLLKPSLLRRQGFLARTLRFQASQPDWLKTRHAEVKVHIAELALGDLGLADVEGNLHWDGAKVEVQNFTAELEGGKLTASLSLDLSKNTPTYQIKGSLHQAAWRDGLLDTAGKLRASGVGGELLASLRADGCFTAHSVSLAPDADFKTLAGCYDFAAGSPARLSVSKLQGTTGADSLAGKGALQADGRIVLEFAGDRKSLRLAGTLVPWKLELAK